MPSLRDIAERSMLTLKDQIEQGAEARGKNATGRTVRSIRVAALGTDTLATGTLSMEAQWKFLGNGRGSGKMPPRGSLLEWQRARGNTIPEFVLRRKIAREGTFDYRMKRPNIVLQELDAWAKKEAITIDDAMEENAYQRTLDVYKRA